MEDTGEREALRKAIGWAAGADGDVMTGRVIAALARQGYAVVAISAFANIKEGAERLRVAAKDIRGLLGMTARPL